MSRRLARIALTLLPLLVLLPSLAQAQPAATPCALANGFAALQTLLPALVGECVGEATALENGDAQQQTSRGLLLWRAVDGWTLFTDGESTVVSGPCGIHLRPVDAPLPWEVGEPCGEGATPPGLDWPAHPWPQAERVLFDMANTERRSNGLTTLAWDPLAARVGLAQAQEAALVGAPTHLDRAGTLPQQRYAAAGGRHYVAENVACGTVVQSERDLLAMAELLHRAMVDETSADDGQRRNLLHPHRTAIGVGVAWEGTRMCLTEQLLNQYVALDPLPDVLEAGGKLFVSGRPAPGYQVFSIGVGYLPAARPYSVEELQVSAGYGDAPGYQWVTPLQRPDGSFVATLILGHPDGPGRYQLFVWLLDAAGHKVYAANPMFDAR